MPDQACPQGRTDYEACLAPFRYCPVKGCGRVGEGVQKAITEGEAEIAEASDLRTLNVEWTTGITGQPLGEPVLAELADLPANPATLDPHSRWVEHKIHRVVWRHAFTDHDCQFTGCLSMMLAESQEMRDVLIEAYERGRQAASGLPWTPGEYADA